MKEELLKSTHGVNFDILDKGGFGGGGGGKKNLFEAMIFSGFNNIEDTFDRFQAAVKR